MYPATGIRRKRKNVFSKLKTPATMGCKISGGGADSTESSGRNSCNSGWAWAKPLVGQKAKCLQKLQKEKF